MTHRSKSRYARAAGTPARSTSERTGTTSLSEDQEGRNKAKSSVRVRVEHIFGHMQNAMGGSFVRCIGMARAKVAVTLMNLAHNLSRIGGLVRHKTFKFEHIGARQMGATV